MPLRAFFPFLHLTGGEISQYPILLNSAAVQLQAGRRSSGMVRQLSRPGPCLTGQHLVCWKSGVKAKSRRRTCCWSSRHLLPSLCPPMSSPQGNLPRTVLTGSLARTGPCYRWVAVLSLSWAFLWFVCSPTLAIHSAVWGVFWHMERHQQCIRSVLTCVLWNSNLQAVKQLLELPLNLTIVSPAHTPNWDLVSDVVNSCSRIYRSSKQCRNRYENVIIPREEGKVSLGFLGFLGRSGLCIN